MQRLPAVCRAPFVGFPLFLFLSSILCAWPLVGGRGSLIAQPAGPVLPARAVAEGESSPREKPAPEAEPEVVEEEEEIPLPPYENLELPEDLEGDLQQRFERAYQEYRHAYSYPDPQPLRTAIASMEAMQTALPKHHLPPYCIGKLRVRQHDYKKARVAFDQAVQLHADFYECHCELGDLSVLETAFEKAVTHYERALAVYPYHLSSTEGLARAMVYAGRFQEARGYLDKVMKRWRPEDLQRLSQELDLVIEGPPWEHTYVVESDNYVIKTNVSQQFAQQASDTAELIRKVYDVVFPDVQKPDRKYLVFVFDSADLYFKCGAPPGSAGFYSPEFRRLSLFQMRTVDETLMVLKHEGFHQYCHEYLEEIPTWFNEGLAEYFAASEPVREKGKVKGMRMTAHPWRLDLIARAVREGKAPPVERLMRMSQQEMYEDSMVHLHYSQAWSICHFCVEGGNPKYQSTFKKYFKSLTSGKDQEQAYKDTFGKLRMDEFEQQWKEHVLALARGESAR